MDSTTNFNNPYLHINSPSIIETITLKYIVSSEDHVPKVVIYIELKKWTKHIIRLVFLEIDNIDTSGF